MVETKVLKSLVELRQLVGHVGFCVLKTRSNLPVIHISNRGVVLLRPPIGIYFVVDSAREVKPYLQ